jgi:hypothetical protein
MPTPYAIALSVAELLTVTWIPLFPVIPLVELGVLPSVVYRISAPLVVVLMLTVWVVG